MTASGAVTRLYGDLLLSYVQLKKQLAIGK